MMVNITIVWISGHQGIQFNDIADCLELWLQVQHVIFPQKVYPPLVLSHTMTWSKLQVILPYNHGKGNGIKIQDVSGFYIRSKFNFCSQKKSEKVLFHRCQDVGISYCCMLLHDTMLRDDSHHTGTTDLSVSECGFTRKTEHFLWRCSSFQQA